MTKKFSTLEPITTPASGDLFAVSDSSAAESKRITFQDLKNSILDDQMEKLTIKKVHTF
jgi:hypothetical protein